MTVLAVGLVSVNMTNYMVVASQRHVWVSEKEAVRGEIRERWKSDEGNIKKKKKRMDKEMGKGEWGEGRVVVGKGEWGKGKEEEDF